MLFKMDANLNCVFINKAYLETLNLQESDVQNGNWQATAIHPDDLPTVVRKWELATRNKTRYDNIQRNFVRSESGDTYIKCRVRAAPVIDELGELIEFSGTVEVLDRL